MQNKTPCLEATPPLPEALQRALASCDELPSLPAVALKVLEICRDDQADIRTLARTIEQDPPLAAKILKVVNSGLLGLSRQIASITQAVSLLGIRKTKIVVLGFSVLNQELNEADAQFDVSRYWGTAISTAIAAQLLAARTGIFSPEEAFVAGLLQNIGVLALWRAMPARYGRILGTYRTANRTALSTLERDDLGADHAAVGAWLIDRWHLPEILVTAVRHHHDGWDQQVGTVESAGPQVNPRDGERLAALLELADTISTLVWRQEQGKQDLWRNCPTLGLSAPQQEDIILAVLSEYKKVSEVFSLDKSPGISPQQLLDAARAELTALALESTVEVEKQERRTSELQKANRELAEAFQQWERAAKQDPLTGLANRKALDDYLATTLPRLTTSAANLGLIILDVDRFKEINDTYGHLLGDRALCAVADVLRSHLRDHDLAARFGGDEFLVVLPNVNLPVVQQVAQRLHQAIGQTVIKDGPAQFGLTASLGISCGEQIAGDVTYQVLLQAADRSLYDAKEAGRNCVGRPLV
jgi:diguanylate cyclase (GGDEF)-like protein